MIISICLCVCKKTEKGLNDSFLVIFCLFRMEVGTSFIFLCVRNKTHFSSQIYAINIISVPIVNIFWGILEHMC